MCFVKDVILRIKVLATHVKILSVRVETSIKAKTPNESWLQFLILALFKILQ